MYAIIPELMRILLGCRFRIAEFTTMPREKKVEYPPVDI